MSTKIPSVTNKEWQKWIVDAEENYDFLENLNLIFQGHDDTDFDHTDHQNHNHSHNCCHTHDQNGDCDKTKDCDQANKKTPLESEGLKHLKNRLQSFYLDFQKWFGWPPNNDKKVAKILPELSQWLQNYPTIFEKISSLHHEFEVYFDLQPEKAQEFCYFWQKNNAILANNHELNQETNTIKTAIIWWYVKHPEHFKKAIIFRIQMIKWFRHHPHVFEEINVQNQIYSLIECKPQIIKQLFLAHLLLLKFVHDYHEITIQLEKISEIALVWSRKHPEFISQWHQIIRDVQHNVQAEENFSDHLFQAVVTTMPVLFHDFKPDSGCVLTKYRNQIKEIFHESPDFFEELQKIIFTVIVNMLDANGGK